jgi:cytochrome c oxidase subunit 2
MLGEMSVFAGRLKPVKFMPVEASTTAGTVDFMLKFIFAISAFFFVIIVGLSIYFVWRFHSGRAKRPEESHPHNLLLEIVWTVIPSILVVVIFYYGFKSYMDISTPPANAYEIQVTAQQWAWMFTYPNGYVDGELHVPVDRPVVLTMTSVDVLHAFFVPAFRAKKDVVPGRYTKVWFEATEPGTYDIMCAEYCGTSHSAMLSKVHVHEPGEYEKWLADASNFVAKLAPADAGKKLYETRGCAQCHSIDGSAHIGPTLKNLFGEQVALKSGEKVTVEENYIRESILDPAKKVVAGFDPVMPTYQGRLKDQEILALIEFLKSLSDKHKSEVLQSWDEGKESGEESEARDGGGEPAGSAGASVSEPAAHDAESGSGGAEPDGETRGDAPKEGAR